MEVSVYKADGKESGKKVTLNESVFGIEPNDHAIYLDIKQYLANQRQGTNKTKERWEVSYSTKKVVRQKGSGGARHGSIKAPIYVGGGRIFGPKPRDYSFKLNKKLKKLARFSALSYKVKESALTLLEPFKISVPKTKDIIQLIQNLKVNDRKVLVVLPDYDQNFYLSSRNLQNVKVVSVNEISTYDIVNATSVVMIDGVQDFFQAGDSNN